MSDCQGMRVPCAHVRQGANQCVQTRLTCGQGLS